MPNLSLSDLAMSTSVSLIGLYSTPRVLVALVPKKTLMPELIFSRAEASPSGMFFLSGNALCRAYQPMSAMLAWCEDEME